MPAGDIESVKQQIASNGVLSTRPGSAGVVWAIKNVTVENEWEVYETDGTNNTLLDGGPGPLLWDKRELISTYTSWYTIKNKNAGTKSLGFKYVVMK